MAAARMRIVEEPDGSALRIVNGGGCLMLFGLPFLLAGLFILQIPTGLIHVEMEGGPILLSLLLPLGFAFAVAGAALMFGRNGITIDRRFQVAVRWWGLIVPFRKKEYPLGQFDRVCMALSKGDSDSPDSYPVSLGGLPGRDPLVVSHGGNYEEARRLAERLARFLEKPLEDTSAGTRVIRDAAHLDETLAAKARRGDVSAGLPPVPYPMRTKVDDGPDGLFLLIPAPDPGPFRYIPLGFALFFACIVAFGFLPSLLRIDGPDYVRYLIVAVVGLLFVAGPVISALRTMSRVSSAVTEVSVGHGLLRVEERSSGKVTAATEIPFDELEELELPTTGDMIDAGDAAGGTRQGGFVGGGVLRLPDGRPAPRFLQFLLRFAKSPGLTARSDRATVTFGRGLPYEELGYLRALILRRIAD